jgi:hypothetical protein
MSIEVHEKGGDQTDLDAIQGLVKLGYKQELLRVRGLLSVSA